MRNYRMTSARRVALRKAQLASARARKGHGRTKYVTIAGRRVNRNKLIRNVAIGTAAAAVVGYNVNYHRKYVTGYHSTSIDSARIIRKTRSWQGQTHVRGTEGKPGISGSQQDDGIQSILALEQLGYGRFRSRQLLLTAKQCVLYRFWRCGKETGKIHPTRNKCFR